MSEGILHDMPLLRTYSCPAGEALGVGPAAQDFLAMIAGPCVIESEGMLREIAAALSALGVRVLRGGSYKLRTLPYSFAGLGAEGAVIHFEVAREFGMLSVSEIVDTEQCDLFARYVDIIQVGARNMRNNPLLSRVARLNKPIILKRDMYATLREWLSAAEHLLYHGAERVVLCERGVRWHDPEFRNLIDFGSIAWIKKYLGIPIIVDPSHGCGRADLVEELSMCAVVSGADGLMVEVHPRPARARCDADQALTPAGMERVIECCSALHRVVGALKDAGGPRPDAPARWVP